MGRHCHRRKYNMKSYEVIKREKFYQKFHNLSGARIKAAAFSVMCMYIPMNVCMY